MARSPPDGSQAGGPDSEEAHATESFPLWASSLLDRIMPVPVVAACVVAAAHSSRPIATVVVAILYVASNIGMNTLIGRAATRGPVPPWLLSHARGLELRRADPDRQHPARVDRDEQPAQR